MFRRKHNGGGKLLAVLLAVIIAAVGLHIFWQLIAHGTSTDNRVLIDVTNRFGLDSELSIPTWLASMLAFVMATLAWIIGRAQKTRPQKIGWYLVAAAGLFVSIDEVSALHELLLQALHILADFGEGQSFFANAWLLLVPVLLIGLALSFRYLRKALPTDTFVRLAVAGAVYLAGALAMEYLSIPMDKSQLSYKVGEVVIEETLELVGMWLVIAALLHHISVHEPTLRKKLLSLIS